jgi:hypothetical protein
MTKLKDTNNDPFNYWGLDSNKPLEATDRSTYHSTDTGNFYLFVDNNWLFIDKRAKKTVNSIITQKK